MKKRHLHLLLAAATLIFSTTLEARRHYYPSYSNSEQAGVEKNTPGAFDYYLLALSWSPDYCATASNTTPQCSIGKKLGFVLHGLWPQFERGYPQNCTNTPFPYELKEQFPSLYPSDQLMKHEWKKHGTCTGLNPEAYLALSNQLKNRINIPQNYRQPDQPFRTTIDELRAAFSSVNGALNANAIGMSCSGNGRFLREVYICFDKLNNPRSCSPEVLKRTFKSCAQPDFLVQSIR
ncbi:MAG: ribonuclease [Pseudomonadota bacterium]